MSRRGGPDDAPVTPSVTSRLGAVDTVVNPGIERHRGQGRLPDEPEEAAPEEWAGKVGVVAKELGMATLPGDRTVHVSGIGIRLPLGSCTHAKAGRENTTPRVHQPGSCRGNGDSTVAGRAATVFL